MIHEKPLIIRGHLHGILAPLGVHSGLLLQNLIYYMYLCAFSASLSLNCLSDLHPLTLPQLPPLNSCMLSRAKTQGWPVACLESMALPWFSYLFCFKWNVTLYSWVLDSPEAVKGAKPTYRGINFQWVRFWSVGWEEEENLQLTFYVLPSNELLQCTFLYSQRSLKCPHNQVDTSS